jgi:hypothetical protein
MQGLVFVQAAAAWRAALAVRAALLCCTTLRSESLCYTWLTHALHCHAVLCYTSTQVHTATSASQYLPVGVDNAWDFAEWKSNFR